MELIAYIVLFTVVPILSGFLTLGVSTFLVGIISGRTAVLLIQMIDGLLAGILGVALFELIPLDTGFMWFFTLAGNYVLMEYRRRLMGRPGDDEIVISQLSGLLIVSMIIN